MFKKIVMVVLLIVQINATELEVTEQGIKLISTNQLINTHIKNSATSYSYYIEKKSFDGSDFILYKNTYLNSSKEECLIPIYKTELGYYKLTKAYCLDSVISYTEHKRIPMFYIYELTNLYLRNFRDTLSNHPMKKRYIYNAEHTEFIFPNLLSYSSYYNEMFRLNLTCVVPAKNLESYDLSKLSCRKTINITLTNLEKNLKEKKDLKSYNKEFFQKLLPEKPIEKSNQTIYNNIAYYLQKAGSNQEAVYLLEKILEKFPKRTVAYYNLGDAYWALGEKEKAKKAYSTYIKLMKAKGKEKRIPKKVYLKVRNKVKIKNDTFFTMLSTVNPTNRIDFEDFKNNPDGYNKFLLMDNKLYLMANMRLDHRVFGFSKPSYDSELMILFSIYTDDVKENPYKCSLGAYYDTTSFDIVYLKTVGDFIKTKIKHLNQENIVYFEKKWIEK